MGGACRDKVVDFQWNAADPWTILSVSDDINFNDGGGTLQVSPRLCPTAIRNKHWDALGGAACMGGFAWGYLRTLETSTIELLISRVQV